MTQNRIDPIREAYESGEIENTRTLIHEALREYPTPELYRLAAEVARSEERKTFFLERAAELEAAGVSGSTSSENFEASALRACPACKTPNPGRNTHCSGCGRSLKDAQTAGASQQPPAADRGQNIRKIIFGVIILFSCLWAVGLLIVGRIILSNDYTFRSSTALTSTVFAALISTPVDATNPTPSPDDPRTTDTPLPTHMITPVLPPTQTVAPSIEVPNLEPGRVTLDDYNFYNPAVSPNHQAIAAAVEINGNWQIVEIDPTSGQINRPITDSKNVYTNPHYSADGQALLLRSSLRGINNIYLVDVHTGEIIQTLTDYPDSIGYPRWMPDYQSFLYKRFSSADAEVFIGYLDGSPPTQLTDNNRYDGSPASSPNGGLIAMSSFIDGNYEIVVLDRNSGGFQQLTNHAGRDSEPVFSPDGGWIAFESDRGGDYNIWALRPDGSDLKQVTFDGRNELIPAFSPDGGWLYFQQRQSNGNFSINRVPWP